MPEDADELDRRPDDGPALEVDHPPSDRHVVLDQANPLHAVADRRSTKAGPNPSRRHDDLGSPSGRRSPGRPWCRPGKAGTSRRGQCGSAGRQCPALQGDCTSGSSGTRRPPRRACPRGRGPEPSPRLRPPRPPSARVRLAGGPVGPVGPASTSGRTEGQDGERRTASAVAARTPRPQSLGQVGSTRKSRSSSMTILLLS